MRWPLHVLEHSFEQNILFWGQFFCAEYSFWGAILLSRIFFCGVGGGRAIVLSRIAFFWGNSFEQNILFGGNSFEQDSLYWGQFF